MKKFNFFINLDKEELWLNEMLGQGFELKSKVCKYKFKKTNDKDSLIKIDYRNFNRRDDFEDYKTLFLDSGWEHIVGSKSSGKQYFKRIKDNPDNDIFSDSSSKAERYKRMSYAWLTLAVIYFPLASANNISHNTSSIKDLYLTPGLWEKTGSAFLKSFLFETPFALGRGAVWIIFPILVILFFIFAYKADKYYKENNN